MKTCIQCGKRKEISEFSARWRWRNTPDGVFDDCTECRTENQRAKLKAARENAEAWLREQQA